MVSNILSIAGTDPTGGAGIHADLKVFSALGTYGMAVVTAVVAQNTCGVRGVRALDAVFVAEQIDAVFEDVRVDAVKIGMVANHDIAMAIAARLAHHQPPFVVLDPVMSAKSGDSLLLERAVSTVRDILVPISTVVTPNLPEAGLLLGRKAPETLEQMHEALAPLLALGSKWMLLKGGHAAGEACVDLLLGPSGMTTVLHSARIHTMSDHGTGCTLSAAMAALLPRHSMEESTRQAKSYLTGALRQGNRLEVGKGHGPVHHFHEFW